MKAIIWTNYGPPDVLQLKEVEKPSPQGNEVLIKLCATTVTSGDCEQRRLKMPFWYRLPMRAYVGFKRTERITILGMNLAGEIEAVGSAVTRFKQGDQVFAATGFSQGTYCEYICLPEEPGEMEGDLASKPSNMTYPEAAAVPVGGIEALHFLGKVNIQIGDKVLIYSDSATVGTYVAQASEYFSITICM